MKHILLIATGGTIASRHTPEGLAPQITPQELLSYVPDTASLCQIDTVQPLNLDSTNVAPEHWLLLAKLIEEQYDRYDGFVICHGTDTLAYTAAALSYLIQHTRKPIVLTGAQRSIDEDTTDAKVNLMDALRYACAGESGVCIVFGSHVIAGTRARKSRTKSYNAFTSLNFPDLASIHESRVVRYIPWEDQGAPVFYHRLNTRVFLLKLTPGMDPAAFAAAGKLCDGLIIESYGVGGIPEVYLEELDKLISQGKKLTPGMDPAAFAAAGKLCDGLIIESYGVGGIPEVYLEELDKLISQGKTVIMATQVPQEGSDLSVYQVGKHVKDRYHLLESYDMTLEATVVKLMWAMGQSDDPESIRKLFCTTVNYDLLF